MTMGSTPWRILNKILHLFKTSITGSFDGGTYIRTLKKVGLLRVNRGKDNIFLTFPKNPLIDVPWQWMNLPLPKFPLRESIRPLILQPPDLSQISLCNHHLYQQQGHLIRLFPASTTTYRIFPLNFWGVRGIVWISFSLHPGNFPPTPRYVPL